MQQQFENYQSKHGGTPAVLINKYKPISADQYARQFTGLDKQCFWT